MLGKSIECGVDTLRNWFDKKNTNLPLDDVVKHYEYIFKNLYIYDGITAPSSDKLKFYLIKCFKVHLLYI